MIEWFNSLPPFIQGVLILAVIATVIMIIQIIMIIIGVGLDNDLDIDADIPDSDIGDVDIVNVFGLKLLTIRNIIAFFAIGGWTCVALYSATSSYPWAIIVGIIAGFVTMVLFSLGMRAMMRLQNDGTKDIKNAIGKTASVYLTIPGNKNGTGKINVVIQETLIECDAMTSDENAILTGEQVIITDVEDNCVIVQKK